MTTWLEKLGWNSVPFAQMLDLQLSLASQSLQQLQAWCKEPSLELVEDIFRLEKEADEARSLVARALVTAFDTPLDREDLSDVSRCIDDLTDSARALVRVGAALKVQPHPDIGEMVANLHDGCKELRASVAALPSHLEDAFQHARQARRPLRLNERIYSSGVGELYDGDDHRYIFRQIELYHGVLRLSEQVEKLADLLDHAINKLS